jgi:hypothetical protein
MLQRRGLLDPDIMPTEIPEVKEPEESAEKSVTPVKLRYNVENFQAVGSAKSTSSLAHQASHMELRNSSMIQRPIERYKCLIGHRKIDPTNLEEINPGEKIAKQAMIAGI